jgi:cob(I)alamin adenosyltransferase
MNLPNPKFEKRGYIQIYTGDGKGKTTATIGLVCRALGRKFKVLVMQFCKVRNQTGEYKYLSKHCHNLVYKSCGLPHYPTKGNVDSTDKEACLKGWNYIKENHTKFDLIALDELNIAIDLGFISVEEVISFLLSKKQSTEIVISGRNARLQLIEMAHLVTEMKPIKHYWDINVQAREGIEY